MTPLEQRLRDRIRRDGPIPVADYMAAVLNDPVHGYYRRGDPIGAAGDFVTAPEISQIFGELIGLWCAVTWRQMGEPARFNLVELGPGRGTLMADALRAAGAVPAFLAAADVCLVEINETLKARQRQALSATEAAWYDTLEDVPPGPAIVIANEFFDALPVEQFVKTVDGWRARCVDADGATGGLRFVDGDAPPQDVALPETAAVGTIFERSPASQAMARDLATRLAQAGGAALVVDYGHARSGAGETLQAVQGHRYQDTLTAPGEADLTAHVDFEALAGAARDSGARPYGPITQGDFLSRLGAETRTRALADRAAPDRAEALWAGHRRLLDPDQMGTLFKVLALAHPNLAAPAGFEDETGSA